jgi:hypothetical protein
LSRNYPAGAEAGTFSTTAGPDLTGPSGPQGAARNPENAIGDHEFPAKMSNLRLIAPAITPRQWLTTV